MLMDEIWEQVLWELSEHNFCFEFLALDMRANHWKSDQQDQVVECFVDCTHCSWLVADLATVNHGLANNNWEHRVVYLHVLRWFMKLWANTPPLCRCKSFSGRERNQKNWNIQSAIFIFTLSALTFVMCLLSLKDFLTSQKLRSW